MRYDKLSETAARSIGNFVTIASDFEIFNIFNQANKKISLNYVTISPSLFSDRVEINDTILSDWFETVKEQYKTDPQLKLKYLVFTYDSVGKKIEIDENGVEKYYQANLDSYKIAEQRHARHILLKAEKSDPEVVHTEKSAKAAEVLKLARDGNDFSELAKEYSEGPSGASGGDLGFFARGSMVPAFDATVFKMKTDEISEVIKTRFGYHIILLEEIKPAGTRELLEVRDAIVKILQRKEAEIIAFQVANNSYEGIIGDGSLKKYGEDNPDAEIVETGFFTRSKPPAAIAADQEFVTKAFALNKGELSSLIKGQSGYAIFYAEDIIEPAFPPFTDVKDRLQADYKKFKSEDMAETTAKKLLADIRSDKDFNTAASDQGLEIEQSGFLSQKTVDQNGAFPKELLSQAFLLSSAVLFPEEVGKSGGDYYVYGFADSQTPEMTEESDEILQLKNDLLRFKQQQMLSAWLMHQEKGATVTQHQSL